MNTHFPSQQMNPYIPNSSSIPNIIFDHWMEKLSPGEFKVLLCIARKTYGWHKDNDLISLKQIEKMTGLHRSGIIKNIDQLVSLGLVTKIKSKTSDGDDAPNRYEINVYCVGGGSLLSQPQVVEPVDQGVVYSVDPQNQLLYKNKYNKEEEGVNAPSPLVFPKNEKEKKKERSPKIFISDHDHQKLLDKFGEEMVQECYERLSQWKEDTPKSKWKADDYRSILRWVVDAVNDQKKKDKKLNEEMEVPEQNKKLAQKVADAFNPIRCKERGCRIDVLNHHVEIVFASPQKAPLCLKYSEKGFKDQLNNILRKLNL